ncbi:non-ribosomal peptide synthetase [Myxosarcina sp. GI1(2024)]
MNNFSEQIAALSPEQRMIFEKRRKQKRLNKVKIQETSKVEITKRKDFSGIFLSFAQQRLWFFQQLNPDNLAYNLINALRFEGNLNIVLLEKVFTEIVRRHESLRTTFTTNSEGLPIQVIAPSQPFKISIEDLQDFPDRDKKLQKLAINEAQKPFDLTKPPLRITLFKLTQTDYVLLLTMHHIISDRWSLGIFVREMKVLYEAFLNQSISYEKPRQTPLPKLPIQYADWAVWQRQYLQGKVLEVQTNYWKKQLANLPILKLPTDRLRPAIATYRGARQSFELTKTLLDSLKTLSIKEGVTLFTLLLTVFKVLLYKYTDQDDVVVGSDIANRNRVETEGLIGFLINTLVLRTDLSENPTFDQLLSRVRQVNLEARENQDLSFYQLVEILNPERDLSEMVPLFQVKFDLQIARVEPLELSNLTTSSFILNKDTTRFELRYNLSETDRGLKVLVEYSTDIFDTSTIIRMIGHYRNLLERVVANPQQRLSDLSLLTEPERQQLLVEWNDTKVEYPQDKYIHQLFELQVEKTPDAVAVVFEEEALTYQQLNQRANQLAHYLQTLGVQPEVLVGICVERSVEMVIGLLAILKAGGAYVPIDPNYPQQRLNYMLEVSQPGVLLIQRHLLESLPDCQAQVVCLDTDWEQISDNAIENLASHITTDNLAYVIYTSGSTGKPKGAMNTHQGILNRLLWMQDAYQLNTTDTVLQKTSFSSDVSVWELFWTLMTGARLVVAQLERHQDPNYLINLILHQQVTTLHFVPSMLQMFLEAESVEQCQSIKRVIASGEVLPAQLQQQFFERLDAQLYNHYGPTEAATDVTYWHCQPDSNLTKVPIGRPIANTQIYILNRDLQPVPIGVPGELYIGGVGLARGYLNRPELTQEKFIANPFKKETRLYKTGDLARYHTNGAIEYLGRIDHQVKIRGFRIELEEIKVIIASHSLVKDCVVIPHEDITGEKRLVAYYVVREQLDINQLCKYLKPKLPEYMIPSAWMELEIFPLTPNGKCDYKALPVPDWTKNITRKSYIAPRIPTEKILANIWQQVLELERVGIHDNFFELGGNSLLATQVVYRVNHTLKVNLMLRSLLEFPTVAELAARIEKLNDPIK